MSRLQIWLLSCLLLAAVLYATADDTTASNSDHVSIDSGPFLDPNDDSFYQAPEDLDCYRPGDLIRSRPVVTIISSSLVKGAHQVLYRTTDTSNHSEATVATLWEPLNPRTPAQLLSYHAYMNSDSFDCNLSWAWINGSASKEHDVVNGGGKTMVEWALSNGLYVVSPDFEGPKAIFFAGFQAGQAALDGMRAARAFFHMPRNVSIGMTGYSGAGSVTAWASNLAERYAPDLNIIGEAHGGTPIDSRRIMGHLDGGIFAGLAGAGLWGLMNAYPPMKKFILEHVDNSTENMLKNFSDRNWCLDKEVIKDLFTNFTKRIDIRDPFDTPIIKSVLDRETLLMNVSSVGVAVPKYPRYIYHARWDEITSFSDEKLFVDQQCRRGADIHFHVLYFTEHIMAKTGGLDRVKLFLGQLFNGTTPKVPCGTDSRTLLNLGA